MVPRAVRATPQDLVALPTAGGGGLALPVRSLTLDASGAFCDPPDPRHRFEMTVT